MATMAQGILTDYCAAAMRHARFERMEDGRWWAEIPPCPGVWGTGATQAAAAADCRDALEGWILLKLRDGDDDLPTIDGLTLYPTGC
jgi:predicted RNase H-like HicB family nuclease